MRKFSYITVGSILEALRKEDVNITRATFRNLEREGFFMSKRTARGWRVYTVADAAAIIEVIKANYNIKRKKKGDKK